jgi:hypothetical protein
MQPAIRHQIFVSSTFLDLQDERRKISEALLKLDCIPAGMELFPATDEEQFAFIKRIIDACDYYIVIIGGRYGTLTKEGISFTEKEYRYARDQGIPVLAFLHDDPESIAAGKTDLDPMLREKLLAFRSELQSNRIVTGWFSSDDLVTKIILAVVNARGAHPRPGWVRGDAAASNAILTEINEANRTIATLTQRLAAAESGELTRKDLTFPIVMLDYRSSNNGNWNRLQVRLDTILLSLGADLAVPITTPQFAFCLERLVQKAKGLINTPDLQYSDVIRVATLLFGMGVIRVFDAPTEFEPQRICYQITPHGGRVLSEVLYRSVANQEASLAEAEALFGLVPDV